MRAGYSVRVCLTESAEKFVSRTLFESLTGQPCLVDVFEEPIAGRMAHIDWARAAKLLLMAPATADVIVKLAYGIANDMVTTIALAHDGLLIVAPAMNPTMYSSDRVQRALEMLKRRGAMIVSPADGDVACGENGQGKLASIESIVQSVVQASQQSELLIGKRILITSGPTREPIDAVRFLSNRSSGRMGAALAQASIMMGGDVTVISGPVHVKYPPNAVVISVETAEQMLVAAQSHSSDADVIIGAAAVADYRPESASTQKIRRSEEPLELKLVPNPDIVQALAAGKKASAIIIGFAAETEESVKGGEVKLAKKKLDLIAINRVDIPNQGFESDDNVMTVVKSNGDSISIGPASKLQCAIELLKFAVD